MKYWYFVGSKGMVHCDEVIKGNDNKFPFFEAHEKLKTYQDVHWVIFSWSEVDKEFYERFGNMSLHDFDEVDESFLEKVRIIDDAIEATEKED